MLAKRKEIVIAVHSSSKIVHFRPPFPTLRPRPSYLNLRLERTDWPPSAIYLAARRRSFPCSSQEADIGAIKLTICGSAGGYLVSPSRVFAITHRRRPACRQFQWTTSAGMAPLGPLDEGLDEPVRIRAVVQAESVFVSGVLLISATWLNGAELAAQIQVGAQVDWRCPGAILPELQLHSPVSFSHSRPPSNCLNWRRCRRSCPECKNQFS